MSQSSELTRASDELARVVALMLPAERSAELAEQFRAALADLLAATLGGATVLAAGAVLAVDAKVDRLAKVRGERLREVQLDVDRLATRIHALEDAFLDRGQVGQLAQLLYTLATDVERLKERAAGDVESA